MSTAVMLFQYGYMFKVEYLLSMYSILYGILHFKNSLLKCNIVCKHECFKQSHVKLLSHEIIVLYDGKLHPHVTLENVCMVYIEMSHFH